MQEVLIEKYGGLKGIRNLHLLESAIAQPQQSAFGEDVFKDIPSKASAYAFYLSENQPFIDGNKRIATAATVTFLRLNGYDLKADEKQLYEIIMKLAKSRSLERISPPGSGKIASKNGKRKVNLAFEGSAAGRALKKVPF